MESQTKIIIDKHFEGNYNYYKRVCLRYYKGRYLFEDLLHEVYLKFVESKEATIKRYSSSDKLYCLGLYYIRHLYRERKRTKRRGKTKHLGVSTLHEQTNLTEFDLDTLNIQDLSAEDKIDEFFKQDNSLKLIDELKNLIIDKLQEEDEDMSVFVMAQTEPIYKMSQRTKIGKLSLQKAHDRARLTLQRKLA